MSTLKETSLLAAHQKLGAHLVEFGGWRMPVKYSTILEEHQAVRQTAGVFDISHMGEFWVKGAGAEKFLNRLLTNDVSKLEENQGQYTLMLNEQGGVIDDLIIYRTGKNDYLLVVNAAKIDEDRAWVEKHLPAKVKFTDESANYSALALQGPKALAIAYAFFGASWPEPPRNGISRASWNCQEVLTARTGYTGEDGLELFFKNEIAEKLLFALIETGKPMGLKPAGLGARDTLRLEACYPLNGSDLSPQRTPVEAGLGFFVALDKKAPFIGQEILAKQKQEGPREKLVAFRQCAEGPPPRSHYPLFSGKEKVGEVTSGGPAPSLGFGIGLAYVRADLAAPGTRLDLEIRGKLVPVEIMKKPFYKRSN